jgi:hypothetical protein
MADVAKSHRKHSNRSGRRQIQKGKTSDQVKAMCRRLGLPFRIGRRGRAGKTPPEGSK